MEDLDSYELRDKKGNLGVFLDQIDDINARLNVVFIATINDTSLVHYALINRPGRFDQVILVKTPQDYQEVYDVMRTRYEKNKINDSSIHGDFLRIDEIGDGVLKEVIDSRYTQADICEIIEKALLMEDTITAGSIKKSLIELKNSKDAIRECNFRGDDPRSTCENAPPPSVGMPSAQHTELEMKKYANRT
jgi:SpoVK/Ycf46/Vps4 family AAA+-type ATPase